MDILGVTNLKLIRWVVESNIPLGKMLPNSSDKKSSAPTGAQSRAELAKQALEARYTNLKRVQFHDINY